MTVIDIFTAEELTTALQTHTFCIVDFYKENCAACKMLDNSFKTILDLPEYSSIVLLKVKMEDVGEAYFIEQQLRQTPTLRFVYENEAVINAPGFSSPSSIKSLIKTVLEAA